MGPCCWGPWDLLTQEVAESCLLRGQACPSGTLRVLKVEKGGRGVLSQDTQPAPAEGGRGSHWGRAALHVNWWESPGVTGVSGPAPCCSLSSGAWEGSTPHPLLHRVPSSGRAGDGSSDCIILQGEGLPAKPRLEVGGRSRQKAEMPPETAGGDTEAGGTARAKSSHTPPRAWSPPGWRKHTQS